jgi:hypothetical protein
MGQLDQKIFSKEFEEEILPAIFNDCPTFVAWAKMLYEDELSKRPENSFADVFGTWFINKIGEKGVDNCLKCAQRFEKDYDDNNIKAKVGLEALTEFLVCDWSNEEKAFVEYRRIRSLIERNTKKIYRKAKNLKGIDPQRPDSYNPTKKEFP